MAGMPVAHPPHPHPQCHNPFRSQELDGKVLAKLRDTLTKSTLLPANARLLLTNKVDADILGGLVIDLGDKTIDLSVASKIAKLNRIIAEPI